MYLKKFANLSITSKLRNLQAFTVGLALVFVLLISSVTQFWHARQQILMDVESTGKMIAYNASAALLFDDGRSATEILIALRSKANIIAAQIFTKEGNPYAHYIADTRAQELPGSLLEVQQQLPKDTVMQLTHIVVQPILQGNDTLGYLYLLVDLGPMWQQLFNSLWQISLVMLAAFLLSLRFGRRFAAQISEPVISLAEIAKEVSRNKNYTLRANCEGEDEIGQLVISFNQMIAQVQLRDNELADHRDVLEEQVEARTLDLRKAVAEAQAANIAKSQFLATMSHEIRTPMNGVLGMAELLLDSELTATQRRFAEMVQKSGESLLAIINDILDFSKIEAGYIEIEQLEFSLNECVSDVVELFAEQAHSKGLDLKFGVAADLPNYVLGDPNRIRQILGNLLSNAIKFTEKGGIMIDVGFGASAHASRQPTDSPACQVCFTVKDTGIGIAENVLPKLFQAFSQADSSTTRKYGGTGLGLVISRQLAELMAGELKVTTKLGQGSAFSFSVPLTVTSNESLYGEEAELKALEKPDSPAIAPASYIACILLAEDNAVNQELTMLMLQRYGYLVDIARNGREALQAVKQKHYDLVLMDCMMPVMDGYEATAEIKRLQLAGNLANFPIIALTANVIEGDREKCLASGMDDYLSKPFKSESLHNKIAFWLKSPGSHSNLSAKTSVPMSNAEVLNEDVLQEIRDLDLNVENHLLQNLIRLYLSNSATALETLEQCWRMKDYDGIRTVSHTLKSSSKQLGVERLGKLCEEVEYAVRNNSLDISGSALLLIKQEFSKAQTVLNKYLN